MRVLITIAASLSLSFLFISVGIIIGSLTSETASAGVSSVVVQLVAFTSGMYFPSDVMVGFFAALCRLLPFSQAVTLLRALLSGEGDTEVSLLLL